MPPGIGYKKKRGGTASNKKKKPSSKILKGQGKKGRGPRKAARAIAKNVKKRGVSPQLTTTTVVRDGKKVTASRLSPKVNPPKGTKTPGKKRKPTTKVGRKSLRTARRTFK